MTGAEFIALMLRHHGIGTVFSLAGGAHTFLLDAIDRAGIAIIGARHETAAVTAAEGYARLGGRLGVACIIEEQGLPSAIAGLWQARQTLSSVLILVSRLPGRWTDAESEYDFDTQSLLTGMAKWARIVPDVDRLPEYLDAAIRRATSGTPGPVVLTMPRDFFTLPCPEEPALFQTLSPPPLLLPNQEDVAKVIQYLQQAERPMILAGNGAVRAGAGGAIARLSERWRIPVIGIGGGRGIVREDDETGFSWVTAEPAVHRADLVMVLGARLLTQTNFGLPPRFSPTATFLRIDTRAEELQRVRPAHLGILADIRCFAEALTSAFDEEKPEDFRFERDWLAKALTSRRQAIIEARDEVSHVERLHPFAIFDLLRDRIPAGSTIAVDGGYAGGWSGLLLKCDGGQRYLDHYPLGQMGSVTPLAIGAAAMAKEAAGDAAPPVVLITGDGAFGYYATSLSEAVRAGLRLVVIVLNDHAWASELNIQVKDKIGRAVNTMLGPQDFEQIARGLGAQAWSADTRQSFEDAVSAAFANRGVNVIDARIVPEDSLLLHRPLLATSYFNAISSTNRAALR